MKVKYKKNNKTIHKDGEIELGNITVIAGENNSGKTQLINQIEESLESDGNNVIKIPAERVIFENEIKTGNKGDEFRQTLEKLVSISFSENGIKINSDIDDVNSRLPELFRECSVDNIKLEVSKKEIPNDLYLNACKEIWVKNIIEKIRIEDLLSKKNDIKLDEAGQGTERLVIVSLIRYLAEKNKIANSNNYLIIEEPEIFLHPKLKKDFNSSLRKLSENGVKVIITTHDPYFISLNKDEKIYRISRDDNGNTKLESCPIDQKLSDKSHSEINYQVFKIPTSDYGLLLYSEIEDKHNSNTHNVFELMDKKTVSLRDFRTQLAHPTEILTTTTKDLSGVSIIQPDHIKNEENIKLFIDSCLQIL